MKIKRTIIIVSILSLLLTGCSLAKPELGEDAAENAAGRLVGVFITTEHLDLFDFDAYVVDHAAEIVNGGQISAREQQEYSGRLYAELKEEIVMLDDGSSYIRYEYVFPIEGIPYFGCRMGKGEDSYQSVMSGEELHEVKNHFYSADVEESFYELFAKLICPIENYDGENMCFYLNPVYQTKDGRVYLTGGQGTSTNSMSPGMMLGTTLSESYTITVNDEEKTYKNSVEIECHAAYIPESLRLLEINDLGEVVNSTVFAAGELPEQYVPMADTAYIISEVRSTALDGSPWLECVTITRDSGEGLNMLVLGDSGFLVNDYCELIWE